MKWTVSVYHNSHTHTLSIYVMYIFLSPRSRVPQMLKLTAPLVGAQSYQKFPLSKPVVGQDIALYAEHAYRASEYQPSICLPGSFNFIFPIVLQFSTVECELVNQNFYLW